VSEAEITGRKGAGTRVILIIFPWYLWTASRNIKSEWNLACLKHQKLWNQLHSLLMKRHYNHTWHAQCFNRKIY